MLSGGRHWGEQCQWHRGGSGGHPARRQGRRSPAEVRGSCRPTCAVSSRPQARCLLSRHTVGLLVCSEAQRQRPSYPLSELHDTGSLPFCHPATDCIFLNVEASDPFGKRVDSPLPAHAPSFPLCSAGLLPLPGKRTRGVKSDTQTVAQVCSYVFKIQPRGSNMSFHSHT